jgi:hypothetical protein
VRWIIPAIVLISLAGCAVTVKPLIPEKKIVYKTRTKVVKVKAKPRETPAPSKLPSSPPFPPPNYDEVIRRTHPTPTISPYDFQ